MKDGYYWVKFQGKWIIAEINNGRFIASTLAFSWCLSELDEIGDYIETPEKYKGLQ